MATTTTDIIKEFFKSNFMIELNGEYKYDDSFLENGIIDSTGVLELVTFLEEEFNINVEDQDIIPENLDSLNNVLAYINSKK